jgi:hypothetical protein
MKMWQPHQGIRPARLGDSRRRRSSPGTSRNGFAPNWMAVLRNNCVRRRHRSRCHRLNAIFVMQSRQYQGLSLLKTSFLLAALNLPLIENTLFAHDFGSPLAPPDLPQLRAIACRTSARGARVASPAPDERSRRRRLRLSRADRLLWVWLSRMWNDWRAALVVVKPETVIAWHRQGFRRFWTWKSRRRVGRPTVRPDVRTLIRTMSTANPLWGAPRIHGEL